MTQLTQGSDMDDLRDEVITGLVDYGSGDIDVAIKRIMDAAETYKQRSIDRAVAERLREIVNFALPDELPSGVDTICASILINTIMERAEQQLSPTTTEDKEVKT